MSQDVPFFHYYSWKIVPDEMIPGIFAEFRDNGVEHLVFSSIWSIRMLSEPGFYPSLMLMARRAGIKLGAVHAPWGAIYDLNCPDMGRRPALIEDHKTAMAYCADAGCRTYTVHVGAYHNVFMRTPLEVLRPLALDTLEKLLPTAEKYNLVIAVENAFELPNSAAEVVGLVKHFASPYIGCCYDSGHANMMMPFPGKDPACYPGYMNDSWPDGVQETADTLKLMSPYIVTAHLHDNNGYGDEHKLPGMGRIDWPALMAELRACPRLLSLQAEAITVPHGHSVRGTVEAYRKVIG